jgi:hypothetical protein
LIKIERIKTMDSEKPSVDYGALIADLETKKAAIEALISYVRIAQTGAFPIMGNIAQTGISISSNSPSTIQPGDVPAGAFHGKSVPEAIKSYLDMVKKKQTIPEITAALKLGGIESISNKFGIIVRNALRRTEGRDFLRSGHAWGLAEWWPATMRNAHSKTNKNAVRKKKVKFHRKAILSHDESPIIARQLEPDDDRHGVTKDKVLSLLRMGDNPDEIAKKLNSNPKVIKMLLGTFVKKQIVQKSDDGKYFVV